MIGVTEASIGFLLLIAFLFLGLHVAVAMFLIALLGAALYLGPPLVAAFGTQLWGAMEDYVLLSIPLYILLGEILVRSGSTDRLYRSLADWLNILPGGLLHTNIGASAVFSAVSGSSVATAATISTVALPSFRKRRYDTRLVLGSIAAGASLGNLIPPGIALIVSGAMTNTSVGQLYAAAVVPGIVMTVLFMGTIILIALVKPDLVRQKEVADPLRERLKRLVDLMPPLVIFGIIMGSIYTGWATVTESAALAVVVALPIAALYGRLSIRMLHECFIATANLTAMSLLILAVAFYLNFVMGLLGVTPALGAFATSIGASPLELIIALTIFYLLLGIFFETLPRLVGTVPVVFPVIVAAGIDPVWFGVFIVLMCEISLISPPVG
ncbi:MAG: TRAP transporter large permease, partial [bacterium]